MTGPLFRQGAAASRGSSTPVARLSCMKVVGPALPTGLRPFAVWKRTILVAQRRIQGLARRRRRLAGQPASWVASAVDERAGGALGERAGVARRRAPERAELALPELAQRSERDLLRPAVGEQGRGVVAQADQDHVGGPPGLVAQARGSRDDRGSSASPGWSRTCSSAPAGADGGARLAAAGIDLPQRRELAPGRLLVAAERVPLRLQLGGAEGRPGGDAAAPRRARRARWRPALHATAARRGGDARRAATGPRRRARRAGAARRGGRRLEAAALAAPHAVPEALRPPLAVEPGP